MTPLSRGSRWSLPFFAFLPALSLACSTRPNGGTDASTAADASGDVNILPPDASAPDAAPDVPVDTGPPFPIAEHPASPPIPDQAGARLTEPQLVLITYADDPNVSTLEAHARWLVTSPWLDSVGPEYGINHGSVLATVHLPMNAPNAITDREIRTQLAAGITAGTYPTNADGSFTNILYMIYFPSHTVVTESGAGAGMQSCMSFGGYHSQASSGGNNFAYAVIPACPSRESSLSAVESEELVVTHEVIEAATDPYPQSDPAFTFDLNSASPWLLVGPEVGDLCALRVGPTSYVRYDTFVATRVWSNAVAIANNADPCVPADPSVPYYSVSVTPDTIQFPSAGQTVTFDLTAWSTLQTTPWRVVAQATGGTFMPTTQLSVTRMNNGDHATLTVSIPAGTPRGSRSLIYLESVRSISEYNAIPLAVVVQ